MINFISKVKDNLKELLALIKRPEMAILPAHLAFFLVLSIVPLFLIIILTAASYFGQGEVVVNFIENTFPADVQEVIMATITRSRFDINTTLFVLISIFVASGGLYSVIVTANALYDNYQNNPVIRRIKAIFLTIILLIAFYFILIVMAFGNSIMAIVVNYIDNQSFLDYLNMIFIIVRWPFAFLYLLIVINLIYTIAPDNNIKIKSTFWGALFTTICWIIVTVIYSFWVDNFASYDLIYGSLSTIIVMMMWIYLLAYFLVLGLAINATIYFKKITRGDKNVKQSN